MVYQVNWGLIEECSDIVLPNGVKMTLKVDPETCRILGKPYKQQKFKYEKKNQENQRFEKYIVDLIFFIIRIGTIESTSISF